MSEPKPLPPALVLNIMVNNLIMGDVMFTGLHARSMPNLLPPDITAISYLKDTVAMYNEFGQQGVTYYDIFLQVYHLVISITSCLITTGDRILMCNTTDGIVNFKGNYHDN